MKFIFRITLMLFFLNQYGQTATIKVLRDFHVNSYEEFDSISFQFNGVRILPSDTIAKVIPLNKELDKCEVKLRRATLNFVTKFKPGEEYIIRPGCCCAIFTLEPKSNPKRGTVTFKNKTSRNLAFVVAETNADTIFPGQKHTTFAHESAMCFHKPCSIEIAETSFLSEKYDYKNDDRDYDALWKEQNGFILNASWFHFLHGEKIRLTYDDESRKSEIKIIGYLTDKEYADFFK